MAEASIVEVGTARTAAKAAKHPEARRKGMQNARFARASGIDHGGRRRPQVVGNGSARIDMSGGRLAVPQVTDDGTNAGLRALPAVTTDGWCCLLGTIEGRHE